MATLLLLAFGRRLLGAVILFCFRLGCALLLLLVLLLLIALFGLRGLVAHVGLHSMAKATDSQASQSQHKEQEATNIPLLAIDDSRRRSKISS